MLRWVLYHCATATAFDVLPKEAKTGKNNVIVADIFTTLFYSKICTRKQTLKYYNSLQPFNLKFKVQLIYFSHFLSQVDSNPQPQNVEVSVLPLRYTQWPK